MDARIKIAPTRRGFISALTVLLPGVLISRTGRLHAAAPELRDLVRQMELQVLQKSRPRKNPSVTCRTYGGEVVLCRYKCGKQEQICALNRTGKAVWEACNGKNRARDISEQIHEQYMVSLRRAQADTMMFLGRLKEIGAIL